MTSLWLGELTLLTLAGLAAAAGTGDEAAIERCALSDTMPDRIACLEAVIRGAPSADPLPDDVIDGTVPTDPDVGDEVAETAPPANESVDAAIDVTVVEIGTSAYGRMIFKTASGESWQQTDTRNTRRRAVPFEAEIRTGASGSFLLQPKAGGVAVRVRRML